MCLQIEERMSSAQELSEGWREIKDQKQDLSSLFQDMEQQLLSFSRRPAELETKIAQNMLSQAKVRNSIITINILTRHISKYTTCLSSLNLSIAVSSLFCW